MLQVLLLLPPVRPAQEGNRPGGLPLRRHPLPGSLLRPRQDVARRPLVDRPGIPPFLRAGGPRALQRDRLRARRGKGGGPRLRGELWRTSSLGGGRVRPFLRQLPAALRLLLRHVRLLLGLLRPPLLRLLLLQLVAGLTLGAAPVLLHPGGLLPRPRLPFRLRARPGAHEHGPVRAVHRGVGAQAEGDHDGRHLLCHLDSAKNMRTLYRYQLPQNASLPRFR